MPCYNSIFRAIWSVILCRLNLFGIDIIDIGGWVGSFQVKGGRGVVGSL